MRKAVPAAPFDVIAIFGPTGVGKTALALALAQRLRQQGRTPAAVSADALQVYRGLEVLTGVADADEQRVLEHRLVSFLPIDRTFSAGEFAQRAHAEIDGLLAEGRTPIVVGGTGLYLRAALGHLDLKPAPPPELRQKWQHRLEADGARRLHAELREKAPWAAEAIDPNDGHRIIRALELDELGALTPPPGDNQLWTTDMRHPTRLIGLIRDRDDLYARIEARIDAMVRQGAAEEVRNAVAANASPTARKALGFQDLLDGDIDAMKTRTRRYAKRQLTWMRKLPGVELVDLTGSDAAEVARTLLP